MVRPAFPCVALTGATGFYGRALTARLLADGSTVHGTSRSAHAREEGVRWHRAVGAEELAQVVRACAPDLVVHLAAPVGAAPDPALVQPALDDAVAPAAALLEVARTGGCGRLVLLGSTEEPLPGAAPASPYAAAKAATTALARMHAALWGTDAVVVRPAMTYGPWQSDDKLLPHVARHLVQGRVAAVSSGRRRGDWVHVDDVVDGLLLAAAAAPAGSEVELGTGVLTSTRDLLGLLREQLGGPEPRWGAVPDREGEPERAADADATERLLGWRPQHDLTTGLARVAPWWRERFAGDGDRGVRAC